MGVVVSLVPGERGAFEVMLESPRGHGAAEKTMLHSKLESGSFPDPDQLKSAVARTLAAAKL